MYRTRKQMEAIIATGASVMLPRGGVATRVEELPTEAQLAKLDAELADKVASEAGGNAALVKLAQEINRNATEREDAAKAELEKKIADLQAQLAEARGPASPTTPPAIGTAAKVAPLPEPTRAPEKK